MEPHASHIQINLVVGVQDPGTNQVYYETTGRKNHHCTTANNWRCKPTFPGSIKNQKRNDDQCDTVYQRGNNFKSVITKSLAGRRGARTKPNSCSGKGQSRNIRKHVTCICK